MRKKFFKTLAIFTAVATGFSFPAASFAQDEDAMTIYQNASEKTSRLTSAEVRSTIDMNMAVNGETTFIPLTTEIKMEGLNSEDLKMEMDTSLAVEEQTIDMTAYYTDGYYYMESGGSKLKYAMDLSEIQNQIASVNPQMDLNPEDFMDISLEETEEGTLLTFTIEGDSLSQAIDSALGSLGGITDSSGLHMNISDIQGTMTVSDDGYISETTMTIPLTSSVADQEIAMDMVMHMEYVNPGQDVTVELPDLEGYEEFDLDALGINTAAETE